MKTMSIDEGGRVTLHRGKATDFKEGDLVRIDNPNFCMDDSPYRYVTVIAVNSGYHEKDSGKWVEGYPLFPPLDFTAKEVGYHIIREVKR